MSHESDTEYEETLGWPAVDGNEVTDEHRAFCREHGHAPDRSSYPSPLCARCGESRLGHADEKGMTTV